MWIIHFSCLYRHKNLMLTRDFFAFLYAKALNNLFISLIFFFYSEGKFLYTINIKKKIGISRTKLSSYSKIKIHYLKNKQQSSGLQKKNLIKSIGI